MQLANFEIKNFKGIEKVTIDLIPTGANVFTLIGLNESGKTTILEAISTFNFLKDEIKVLYGVDVNAVSPNIYVPKSLKSNFTGDITVSAKIILDEADKQGLIAYVLEKTGFKISLSSIPNSISVTRGFKFENSDFKSKIYTASGFTVKAKGKGDRKDIVINHPHDVWKHGTDYIIEKIPEIIYFPTFIFNQPEKIILNPISNENPLNKIYREIISNIAASLTRPLDVQAHIVDRILGNNTTTEKILSLFMLAPDKQQQIEATLSEMASHVTSTVFTSWTKIFGGDFSGREIVLKPGIQSGNGKEEVYLQFAIKDRRSTYDITERSLGFRWFFSFLLFTFYRKSIPGRSTMFLLDEPASNLHARAQMQLLDNLSKIATNGNYILYSTHSHYLINPEWLDQAYIVSNRAIDYENMDARNEVDNNGHTSISAEKYRNFVGKNPDRVTYFQPVLDTLDVIPSRLDVTRKSVLVEGKGDYLVLEYVRKIILETSSDINIVPTRGATGMDELIGLFMGWGIPFVICLDDDKEGKAAQKKYIDSWGLSENKVWTLKTISEDLANKEIFGLLAAEDINLIKEHYGISKMPTKSQVQLFFSEYLATGKKVELSKKLIEKVENFEAKVAEAFVA